MMPEIQNISSGHPKPPYLFNADTPPGSGTNKTDPPSQDAAPHKRPVKSILFIDDEDQLCKVFRDYLERFGYTVFVGGNGEEGMRLFRDHRPDLVITDIFMPIMDGHTLIYDIIAEFPDANIFAITGFVSYDPVMELNIAQKLGAIRTFVKPVKLSTILEAIKKLAV